MSMAKSINVFGAPLAMHGTNPMTGFFRSGKCDTSPADQGAHTVAAVVTPAFLEFSASKGNDLTSVVSPGCKWCLCVSRWLEAYRHSPDVTPPVILNATHQEALNKVTLEQLQEFEYKGSDQWNGETIHYRKDEL